MNHFEIRASEIQGLVEAYQSGRANEELEQAEAAREAYLQEYPDAEAELRGLGSEMFEAREVFGFDSEEAQVAFQEYHHGHPLARINKAVRQARGRLHAGQSYVEETDSATRFRQRFADQG